MNYYTNRKWLQENKKKNEETLNKMRKLSQKKQYDLDRQIEEYQRRNFVNIAKNLHHLISKREILGIYNTPYLLEELNNQVYNADIEEHLKSVFKKNYNKNKPSLKSINKKILVNPNKYGEPNYQKNYLNRRPIQYE